MKAVKRLVLVAAVVGVVSAFGAASASAVVFMPQNSSVVQSGTLTWKLNGGTPVTCTFNGSGFTNSFFASVTFSGPCSNGSTNSGQVWEIPQTTTSVQLQPIGGNIQAPYSISGNRSVASYNPTIPFVVGNASTPSKVVFNNTVLGHITSSAYQVTLTGHLNITTSSGGLVTIN